MTDQEMEHYKALGEYYNGHMNDLISRQAVIDAIYNSRAYFTNEFNRGFFIDKIRDIQPAKPKQGEWIYNRQRD